MSVHRPSIAPLWRNSRKFDWLINNRLSERDEMSKKNIQYKTPFIIIFKVLYLALARYLSYFIIIIECISIKSFRHILRIQKLGFLSLSVSRSFNIQVTIYHFEVYVLFENYFFLFYIFIYYRPFSIFEDWNIPGQRKPLLFSFSWQQSNGRRTRHEYIPVPICSENPDVLSWSIIQVSGTRRDRHLFFSFCFYFISVQFLWMSGYESEYISIARNSNSRLAIA